MSCKHGSGLNRTLVGMAILAGLAAVAGVGAAEPFIVNAAGYALSQSTRPVSASSCRITSSPPLRLNM